MRWIALGLLTCSCAFLRSPTTPMPAAVHLAPATSNGLIVLLPGFGDGPEAYQRYGFVDKIRAANPRFDVIAADAHFGYYRGFTVVDRLHQDLIAPVAERYRHIWLVGISMGGLGAVGYTLEHRDLVEGLILLAPYMGDSDVIEEVVAAGGLAAWTPPDLGTIEDDETRKYYELWSFYRGYVTEPEKMPKLYLGYGDEDGLRDPNGLVGGQLPPDQFLTMPGGHKWVVWTPLFDTFVVRALGALE